MSTPATPAILQAPDLGAAYENTFDALGDAYWHASDIQSKDLIHGTQMAIGDIIDALDEQDLAANTGAFAALLPQLKNVNDSLTEIKDKINTITRDFTTASSVLSAINKVLSLMPL